MVYLQPEFDWWKGGIGLKEKIRKKTFFMLYDQRLAPGCIHFTSTLALFLRAIFLQSNLLQVKKYAKKYMCF